MSKKESNPAPPASACRPAPPPAPPRLYEKPDFTELELPAVVAAYIREMEAELRTVEIAFGRLAVAHSKLENEKAEIIQERNAMAENMAALGEWCRIAKEDSYRTAARFSAIADLCEKYKKGDKP